MGRLVKCIAILAFLAILVSCDVFLSPKAGLWNPKDPDNDLKEMVLTPELDGFIHGDDYFGTFNSEFDVPELEYDYYHDGVNSGICYTLLRFDLSGIPAGSFVAEAKLTLTIQYIAGGAYSIPFQFRRIAVPWDPARLEYEAMADSSFIAGPVVSKTIDEYATMIDVDIKDIFNEWLSGSPNYGLRIKADSVNGDYEVASYASESGGAGPTLTISYGVP